MQNNVFTILGIEDKELKVSNLLAYYMKPENEDGSHTLLNIICSCAGINPVGKDESVEVIREYSFPSKKEEEKQRKNYIDILIKVGEKPDRIICIENKIFAEEGHDQTKRYVNGIKKEFEGNGTKQFDFVYLTRNNSAVNLSNKEFRHVRYYKLISEIEKTGLKDRKCIEDFCEFYGDKDLEEIDEDKEYDDPEKFIKYLVWKANQEKNNEKYHAYFVKSGKSANSDKPFFHIAKQEWMKETNDINDINNINKEYSIHLEGYWLKENVWSVKLHFELFPYVPYSKIKEKDLDIDKYNEIRDSYREIFYNVMQEKSFSGYRMKEPASNQNLTIVSYVINPDTYKNTFELLMDDIVEAVDNVLAKNKIIDLLKT